MDTPVYKFTQKEGEEALAPVRRSISKTMETTETFTMYDVLTYIAKIRKSIDDKKAEITGLEAMLKAYEDEVALIEGQLGVADLDAEFQKEKAQEVTDAENKA